MGSMSDKAKGAANEIAGNVKQGIAETTGDPALHEEGRAQERKGEAQQTVGKAKDKVKNVVDRL